MYHLVSLKPALKENGWDASKQEDMFRVLASILHLGNITFMETEGDAMSDRECRVENPEVNEAHHVMLCQCDQLTDIPLPFS